MRSTHHPAGDRLHGPVSRRALLGGATAVAAAQSGQVDLACVYPGLSGQTVNGFTLRSLPTFGYRAITLPCQAPGAFEVEGQQVGNAAAGDPALRRAMATGVNRQQMIDDSLMGHGTVALDIFDSFDWGIKADTASLVDGDVAGAQRVLEDAGWRAGSDGIRAKGDQRASFQLLYPSNDSGRQAIAEAFSAQMAPLGIEVEPTSGDFTWQVDHNRSNAVVLGGGRLNPYHEYTMLHSSLGHSRGWSNISCYANPIVDGHLDEALAASDQGTAREQWHAALWDGTTGGSILGDAPYVTICYIVTICSITHNYFVRDGLGIGTQSVHPHDHFLQVIHNLGSWGVSA